MTSSFLEIVELDNGDIALHRLDDNGEPLVVIQFSEESRAYLMNATLEVARAMFEAGMHAAGQLSQTAEAEPGEMADEQAYILH